MVPTKTEHILYSDRERLKTGNFWKPRKFQFCKMCANTILLDFSVDPAHLLGEGLCEIEREVVGAITTQLEVGGGVASLEKVASQELSPLGDFLSIYAGPRASVISIRTYPNGLVTLNIDYFLPQGVKPLLTLESIKALEMYLASGVGLEVGRSKHFPPLRRGAEIDVYKTTTAPRLAILDQNGNDCRSLEQKWGQVWGKGKRVKTLPALQRGQPHDIYFLSSDERLMEYDIDQVVFDEHSPFQHVQIVHSLTFGNMLVLDDLQNLAESDLIYTESIMCRGQENYEGKGILILGGGDGALLYELRKENPKFVTMIEIDDLVMQMCKVHMRSVCGDTLDTYKGENYEIIVGDCVEYMKNCGKEGKKFDYVFGDLTDIPISSTPQGEIWDFIRLILNLSFSILKPEGKYMTHGNGSSSPGALKMFEEQVERLEECAQFSRTHAFVPSFMEDWVFYQIWRKQS